MDKVSSKNFPLKTGLFLYLSLKGGLNILRACCNICADFSGHEGLQ